MNKNALHPDEVKVIRGEAKILEMLVGESNIVQITNFYETQQHIFIEMEYLEGI